MNPFRDRSPERAAERYLRSLRDGHVGAIAPLVAIEHRNDVLEAERKWPLLKWRIGARKETPAGSELMYWVERGNGYSDSYLMEEVRFRLVRFRDGLRVVSYSAVY